jgi:glycosyltransferase involved in cell wall biosynthesis
LNKVIAILLDGPIHNDGRVRRVIESLSIDNSIHLYYTNGSKKDLELFNNNVTLFQYSFHEPWLIKNVFFHKKFIEMEKMILKSGVQYDFIYCNDYPLLYSSVKLKKVIKKTQLIYDSHEIYIETLNQFFPRYGWKALYGIPLILTNKILHNYLESKLVSRVDHFITVCESFKNYFENKYQLKNILIVKNCPKIIDFPIKNNRIRKLLSLDQNDFILLYQGNINPGRGIEKMIDLSLHLKDNQHIVIIGNGYLLQDLKVRVNRINAKNIYFLGEIAFNDLLTYTASADLGVMFIQPINKSKELTLPNKVFEYMAAGLPVLTNMLPEAKRIVEKFECGYSINDDNLKEIALFIDNASNNKERLEEMGRNGQNAIKKELNWNSEIQKVLKIIEI